MADGNLFINKINRVIKNNKSSFYGKNDQFDNIEEIDIKNIYQKINNIFKSRNYIYKADVLIKTKSGEYEKIIIGRNSDYLITNESELIPISDILDIKSK